MQNKLIDIYYSEIDGIIKDKITNIESRYKIKKNFCSGSMERYLLNESSTLNVLKKCDGKGWSYKNPKDGRCILEIGYCLEGKMSVEIIPNGKKISIGKGDIILYISNNEIDEFKFNYDNITSVSVHIDIEKLYSTGLDKIFLEDLEYTNIISLLEDENIMIFKGDKYIETLSKAFLDIELNSVIDFLNLKLESNMYVMNILNYVFGRIRPSGMKEKYLIESIKDDIQNNISSPLTIKELEVKYNISAYTLQKTFKKLYNKTYYEYVKMCRIQKSIELLEDKDLNIIDISNIIGYENPSKYTEAFKSIFNITPSEYRMNKI